VIGIGNELRGDDAAGLAVARAVGGLELTGDPVGLLELWAGAREVVVVDAARSGARPGTIHRIDAACVELPAAGRLAGHAGGVAEAIALAGALGRLPAELRLIGIEGASFELGAELSAPVREAIALLVEELSPHGQDQDLIPSRPANASHARVAKDSRSQ
jgi:hydrogenase maturation protease